MTRRWWIGWLGVVLSACSACAAEPAANPGQGALELKTTRDQASYALGVSIGRSLQADGMDVNVEAVVQGLRDMLRQSPLKLTEEQCQMAMGVFQREMGTKLEERRRVQGDENRRTGQAFLAANGKKPGVVVLPSGLQYAVLKSGSGPTPKLTDKVRAHYHGTLADGTVFDSSVQRGKPEIFAVGGLIRGWTEALQRMKVGDKWQLFVPSELAYGSQGAGPVIGPHAVLVFEIELLGIE